MTLQGAPLLFVFYETYDLGRQRQLLEGVIGLPVIENQFHPPHERHGLVKYDAGGLILSLNLSVEGMFRRGTSAGLTTVIATRHAEELTDLLGRSDFVRPSAAGRAFTDRCGHHYMFRAAPAADPPRPSDSVAEVSELRLAVGDIEAAVTFYTRVLGLDVRDRAAGLARFATGTVDLTVEQRDAALDGRPVRYDTYLLVFHAAPIQAARDRLQQRGLVFKSRGIGVSDIGATARFFDPWGHPFCLYEPSDESLAWGSGAKVKSLVASAGGGAGVSRFARRDDEGVLSEGTWGPWIT